MGGKTNEAACVSPLSKAMVGSGVCLVLVEFNQNMGESSLVDEAAIVEDVNFGPSETGSNNM